jgi:hypothetical protein
MASIIAFAMGRMKQDIRQTRRGHRGYTAMWQSDRQILESGRVVRYTVHRNGVPMGYSEVLRQWQDDEAFCSFFASLLASAELSAYRWETPPLTKLIADRPFEFVLLDAPGLSETADAKPFSEHFAWSQQDRDVTIPRAACGC